MKCKYRAWVSACVSLFVMLIAGCGKDGGVSKSPANPFAGTYASTYSGATSGSLTIAVEVNGNSSVAITDSSAGVLIGNGSVDAGGKLNAIAIRQGENDSVVVSGQFVNNGGNITCTGSMTGSIFVSSWSASKIAGPGENAFAGNYSGTYWGDEMGTWTIVIRNDGSVNGTALSPSVGTLTVTGTTSLVGVAVLQGSGSVIGGPVTVSWSGTFRLENSKVVCSGQWSSSSGDTGSWSGQKM